MEGSAADIVNESDGNRCASSLECTKPNITKLLHTIWRYQEKVKKHIDDNYVLFQPNRTSADFFLQEGEELLGKADLLLEKSAAIGATAAAVDVNDDLLASIEELKEELLALKVSLRILKIDDYFQCIQESNNSEDYVALEYLEKLRKLIFDESDVNCDRQFQKSACFNVIMMKYHMQANTLEQNLQQRFDKLVQLTEKSYPNGTKCVTLKISKDVVQLQNITMALFQARWNPTELCHFLLKNLLEPLIRKPVSVDFNENDCGYVKLMLLYSLAEVENALRPSYEQVFERIKQLFGVLANLNVSISPEQHVFTILGDNIKEDFLRILVDECLVNAIPRTMDEMKQSTLVADVLSFEQMLTDAELIDNEKDCVLSKFTENFERLAHERLFEKVLKRAKRIMEKNMQDTTIVSENITSKDLEMNPFNFPKCAVSNSTLELVKLLERLLQQPGDAFGKEENVYLDIIPKILHTYVDEMPLLHRKLLEGIPQQSALFYNNSMYLAYWIARNAGRCKPVTTVLQKILEAIGIKYLNFQIDNQHKNLKDILKELDLSVERTFGQAKMLKLIKRCLSQLELLKNVWENVLPPALYKSTLCDLLNEFCANVIERILSLERISAGMANDLSELIELILVKVPPILKEKHDVLEINSWSKLQQLKIILNASLLEITLQWCEGAGTLAENYKATEIRHFIKARFPNTYSRREALTKI